MGSWTLGKVLSLCNPSFLICQSKATNGAYITGLIDDQMGLFMDVCVCLKYTKFWYIVVLNQCKLPLSCPICHICHGLPVVPSLEHSQNPQNHLLAELHGHLDTPFLSDINGKRNPAHGLGVYRPMNMGFRTEASFAADGSVRHPPYLWMRAYPRSGLAFTFLSVQSIGEDVYL